MNKPSKEIEIVDITRRCFPKRQPITMGANANGCVVLRPGELVVWREDKKTVYMLRNAHWFKRLTIHFVEPIKDTDNGRH